MITKLTNRIYKNMLVLTIGTLLLVGGIFGVVTYVKIGHDVKYAIQQQAHLLKDTVDKHPTKLSTDFRLTLVSQDGTVLKDTTVKESQLNNHLDRQEIKQAFATGVGESFRQSDTLLEQVYYYAVKQSDGSVLRLSKTLSSLYGIYFRIVPLLALLGGGVCLLSVYWAKRLTRQIVEPINTFDWYQDTPVYEELAPFVQTIKKQKEEIKAAIYEGKQKDSMIQSVIQGLQDGVLIIDKKGRVLFANSTIKHLLTIHDIADQQIIFPYMKHSQLTDGLKQALNGQTVECIVPIEDRMYQVFFSPVEEGMFLLMIDASQKQKNEKMRREFTANVSHELKTPLTTILGYSELLSKNMVKAEDVMKVSGKMKKEAERLLALIEDTMRLGELDEIKTRDMDWVDFSHVIQEVYEALLEKASKKNIILHYNSERIIKLFANRRMMFELVYNLVDNAIKYTLNNGQVEVRAEKDMQKVTLIVKDTGIGMEKDYYDRIFERFYRIDKARSRNIEGTGLGLAIVKHIVAYHNGTIQVDSVLQKGSVFTVILPSLQPKCPS